MQLSKLIDVEKPQAETTACSEKLERKNSAQCQDAQQAPTKFEVKSVCQDTFEHMQIEAFKDAHSVSDLHSLLQSLRDGSQISHSAHDSLSKALQVLSGAQEAAACHSDKDDGRQSPSERRDVEMAVEAAMTPAGIKAPKRKSASRPFKDPSSKRQQLTSEEAAEIYSMRPEFAKGSTLRRGCMVQSKLIAPHFGVTPKTVRDIWHARTWVTATRHLWTEEEIAYRASRDAESEDEDRADSSGSVSPSGSLDSMKLHPLAHNWAALSSLQSQAMMGGMAGLPFHLPFPSSALAHPFSAEQQHAALSGLVSHGIFNAFAPQHAPMAFAGCDSGFDTSAHKRVRPEVSASRVKA